MNLKKALFLFLSALVVLAAMTVPAFADGGQYGQYGGGGGNPSEQPKEEVTHKTVEADLGDNPYVLAALIGSSAIGFYILSKVTARVYLLD